MFKIFSMYYYYYWYSALGPVWAETRVQSGDWYGSGTLHPGQVLRGSLPLLSPTFQMFPLFTTRCLYFVTSYLAEKLSKLRSFDRQQRRPQNCPFQSSFTQKTAQFTQGIPHTHSVQYVYLLNKYLKCSIWRLALWYDIYICR